MDISAEIGERVRALILALIVRSALLLSVDVHYLLLEQRPLRRRIPRETTSGDELPTATIRSTIPQGTYPTNASTLELVRFPSSLRCRCYSENFRK